MDPYDTPDSDAGLIEEAGASLQARAVDGIASQTLRPSFYREPAGASTGVPLADIGAPGVLAAIDTIAMA